MSNRYPMSSIPGVEEFSLNYPAGHKPGIGSVVGPNWAKEFFVVTGYEKVEPNDRAPYVRATLVQLTRDRQELLTQESKREFLGRAMADQTRRMNGSVPEVPTWAGLREMLAAFKGSEISDILVSIDARKRLAAA